MTRFGMDLAAQDIHGQTIVHYAARRGELQMLKYLEEIGPQHGITLNMTNAFDLAPITYTMLNQQVYAFIYLYFKMKCPLDKDKAIWAIKHMVRQSTETTIIRLLLHDVKLGHIVAREAVDQAVETGNVQVLKAVLKRLITTDTQCKLNIVTVTTLQTLLESTDEPEIK